MRSCFWQFHFLRSQLRSLLSPRGLQAEHDAPPALLINGVTSSLGQSTRDRQSRQGALPVSITAADTTLDFQLGSTLFQYGGLSLFENGSVEESRQYLNTARC